MLLLGILGAAVSAPFSATKSEFDKSNPYFRVIKVVDLNEVGVGMTDLVLSVDLASLSDSSSNSSGVLDRRNHPGQIVVFIVNTNDSDERVSLQLSHVGSTTDLGVRNFPAVAIELGACDSSAGFFYIRQSGKQRLLYVVAVPTADDLIRFTDAHSDASYVKIGTPHRLEQGDKFVEFANLSLPANLGTFTFSGNRPALNAEYKLSGTPIIHIGPEKLAEPPLILYRTDIQQVCLSWP